MKPIDISQVGKIISPENKQTDSKIKKGDSKFDEILEAEFSNKKVGNEKTQKVENIMPSSQLLNITSLSNDAPFINKGLQLCNKVDNILSKIVTNSKENKNIKELFSNLNQTLNDLIKVSENVQDKNAKDLINRTIFISNIELEKYIRGDYQ